MNILFEEDGAFKAGVVLADNTASLQVELASGKRSKVKAANVLLRFEAPPPAELMQKSTSSSLTPPVCGPRAFTRGEFGLYFERP